MSGYTGRKRKLDDRIIKCGYMTGTSPSVFTQPANGFQVTSSRSNPGWLSYKKTGHKTARSAMGSDFLMIRKDSDPGELTFVGSNGLPPSNPLYRGAIADSYALAFANGDVPGGWAESYTQYDSISVPGRLVLTGFANIDAFGATAISRCAPTNPHAGLAVALKELKSEGLPSLTSATLKGTSRSTTRNLADDNLKAQFGLLPIVSDMKDFYTSLRDHKKILAQYARDSGRPVHRTYRFPVVETTTMDPITGIDNGPWPHQTTDYFQAKGSRFYTETTTTERWFSGSFVYHRAGGTSQWNTILQKYQDMNHLLGTGIGPGTVWSVLPWSWAVDWFTNVGDVMNNIQMMMNDGLIMDYGYVMETLTSKKVWERHGTTPANGFVLGGVAGPRSWGGWKRTTRKQRRQANPFGFGITYGGLSVRQMSILASLGITRSSRVP